MLRDVHVALLVEEQYEDLELWYPYYRLQEAGARVSILGTGREQYTGKRCLAVRPDGRVDDARAEDYAGVVVPGGYAPDHMRRHRPLLAFVKALAEQGKPVAFICHAGWVTISAGIVAGRQVTSVPAIRDDLENAGATWLDEPVVRDGQLISSRRPADLPVFLPAIIQALG